MGAVDETLAPVAVISLPGGQKIQSFDISFVDPVIGIYILGDHTNKAVDVIDTTTNTALTQLTGGFVGFTGNNDTSCPDGVLTVSHHEVWGDGDRSVKVIDLSSQHVTHTISKILSMATRVSTRSPDGKFLAQFRPR